MMKRWDETPYTQASSTGGEKESDRAAVVDTADVSLEY